MEILGMVLLVLFSGASLIALLAAVNLLAPVAVEAARKKIESNLLRSFLIGLVNLAMALALLLLLGYGTTLFAETEGNMTSIDFARIAGPGILAVLGILVALTVCLFSARGLSALGSLLGTRIGRSKSPFWSDVHGGLLLVLACLTPYMGWFVFAPFAVCVGLGASIQTLARRKTARAKA